MAALVFTKLRRLPTYPRSFATGAAPAPSSSGLQQDMARVLQSRPAGPLSGQPLGNTINTALWTPSMLSRLDLGLRVAGGTFFPQLNATQAQQVNFRRLLLCELAQESTGNPALGVTAIRLDDHRSQGPLQVTPGSVVKDYLNYGLPITDTAGTTLLSPQLLEDAISKKKPILADPCISLLLWAWYTSNCVVTGVSFAEWHNRKTWNIATGGVTPDFGNCQLTWLAGPHNDRYKPTGKAAYQDYYNRMHDYWVGAAFGTRAAFDALLATPIPRKLRCVASS